MIGYPETTVSYSIVSDNELRLFEGIPGNNILLFANPPRFTILAATEAFSKNSGRAQSELIGKDLFNVFPSNPDDKNDTGEVGLAESLNYVVANKKKHELRTQRYDIKGTDGVFEERYWNASNTPVLGDKGEVKFIVHSAVEVTHVVKAQQKDERIKELEQSHTLLMQAPLAIAILSGPDFEIVLANEPVIELWGKGRDIIGRSLLTVSPEIVGQGFVEIMNNVIATEQPFKGHEMPVVLNRNGNEDLLYFNFVYQPYYVNGQAKPTGIVVFANEVTEQVLSKQQVEQGEQRIRSLVESAPFPIGVYVGREMKIELANKSIIEIYGKGDDVIGKRYAEILPELEHQEIFKQLDLVFTTGKPFHAKNQRVDIKHDGDLQIFYFNYSFTPLFDASGKVYGVMNTAADVTDLALAKREAEESERILRSIIMQAPVAISILRGEDHVLEIANEAALKILNKDEVILLNKPLFQCIPELEQQGIKQLFDEVYKTGKIFQAAELPVRLMRNNLLTIGYYTISYEPLFGVDGRINGVLSVGIEVTDQVLARKKIEEVVAQRTRELEEANIALTRSNNELKRSNVNLEEFAYAASHDLQEPIRKIRVFSDRVQTSLGQRLSDEEKQSFERMEVAAKRMNSLIEDLLSYSQVGLLTVGFDRVDLSQVVKMVLSDLDLLIEEKRASVSVDKLCWVNGHHRQLQQAFHNLLSNALKYSKPDVRPLIAVRFYETSGRDLPLPLSISEASSMFCVIEVSDNGIGFEQSEAERIFNVFTRLHGNFEYEGTGIGLSIVRKVVQNHGGFITAKSEPGKGSTFIIYLPTVRM